MTLEELQELVEKDLKINETELDLESLKTPQLHNKFMKHLNNFKLLLTRANSEYYLLKKEKWEYYTGKASPDVYKEKPFHLKILRTDIDKYLDSDEELVKADQKVKYLETVVDYLDRTVRQITNRTFTIKNAIDWRKFTSGAI
tara:strand:+ start:521 stop:949 length:429 start_codon:yes stop_codon:yes gene_type:complete